MLCQGLFFLGNAHFWALKILCPSPCLSAIYPRIHHLISVVPSLSDCLCFPPLHVYLMYVSLLHNNLQHYSCTLSLRDVKKITRSLGLFGAGFLVLMVERRSILLTVTKPVRKTSNSKKSHFHVKTLENVLCYFTEILLGVSFITACVKKKLSCSVSFGTENIPPYYNAWDEAAGSLAWSLLSWSRRKDTQGRVSINASWISGYVNDEWKVTNCSSGKYLAKI